MKFLALAQEKGKKVLNSVSKFSRRLFAPGFRGDLLNEFKNCKN
jgi:hypothetical protein